MWAVSCFRDVALPHPVMPHWQQGVKDVFSFIHLVTHLFNKHINNTCNMASTLLIEP